MNNKASTHFTNTSSKCVCLFPYFPSSGRRLAGGQHDEVVGTQLWEVMQKSFQIDDSQIMFSPVDRRLRDSGTSVPNITQNRNLGLEKQCKCRGSPSVRKFCSVTRLLSYRQHFSVTVSSRIICRSNIRNRAINILGRLVVCNFFGGRSMVLHLSPNFWKPMWLGSREIEFFTVTAVSCGLRTIITHVVLRSPAPVFQKCVRRNNQRWFIRDFQNTRQAYRSIVSAFSASWTTPSIGEYWPTSAPSVVPSRWCSSTLLCLCHCHLNTISFE
jgi:hypothetical protein